MPPKGKPAGKYKKIDGKMHKLCRGPLHRQGKFVPFSGFLVQKSGRMKGMLRSHCRACESSRRGTELMVPINQTWKNWIDEIIWRIGVMETCRRLGRSQNWLYLVRKGKTHSLQRRTAREILHLLRELRANEEARHKKSIKHGAKMRGHRERIPVKANDFNGANNANTDYKKIWSRQNPDKVKIHNQRTTERRRNARAITG